MSVFRQVCVLKNMPDWLRVVLCLSGLTAMTAGAYWGLPASLHYHITERYLLSAESDAVVYLGLLLPKSDANQIVEHVDVSWPSSVEWENGDGVDVLKLKGDVEASSDYEARVDYDVVLFQNKLTWAEPVQDFQLKPQSYIESDCPTIIQKASLLANGASRDDAYQIYKFTAEHISWSEAASGCKEFSALHAYEMRAGTCSGYANLMVALCRASGIPAQRISGVLLPDLLPFVPTQAKAWEHPGEAHGWVEFHTEHGWETADPTCASGVWKWLQFGRNNGHHLSFGEADSEGRSYREVYLWATRQGDVVGQSLTAIKFVATAVPADVSITPTVTLQKRWDGRIFNALMLWSIVIIPVTLLNRQWVKRQ